MRGANFTQNSGEGVANTRIELDGLAQSIVQRVGTHQYVFTNFTLAACNLLKIRPYNEISFDELDTGNTNEKIGQTAFFHH